MARTFYDLRYSFSELDLSLNIVNDIAVIGGDNEYIQIVLLRLLIKKGGYSLNPELGSDLYLFNGRKSTSIT